MKLLSAHGALVAIALSAASPVAAQSVKAGIAAWQAGDFAKAVAIWQPLARAQDSDAAFNLGQAYRLGKGVPLDLGKAQSYFEQAARKGHVDAATNLGILLFQNGNRTGALRWLKQAAGGGEPRALLLYGTALFNGDGIASDPVTAYAYVSRAAAQGLAAARATLADMDAVMPLEQRQQGLALAKAVVAASATARPAVPPPAKAAAPVAKPATTAAKPVMPIAKAPTADGAWRIQLGAFSKRSSAEALFAKLSGRIGARTPFYVPAGAVIRLQVGP
jgi:tetratricopeptide (TPR) repeat protein